MAHGGRLHAPVALSEGRFPIEADPALPESIELLRVRAPLRRAHRSAHGEQAWRESVLVGWHTGSTAVGWAECPTLQIPGYVTETTDAAWAALVQELAPAALAGRSPTPLGAPAAAAAMIDAACDAALRLRAVPLGEHLGELTASSSRSAVPWCAVLAAAGAPAEQLVAEAREAVGQGASMVKVKVASAEEGSAVLPAVIEAVEVPVAADANGSLDRRGAARLDGLGLAYLEQPVPPGAPWDDLAALRSAMSTPIALDESLTSLDAVRSALLAGALDVVSLKPSRLGGCVAAARAAALARSFGAQCFVGGMFELGIGRSAALGVASLDLCGLPTDLGPSQRYLSDCDEVCEPIVVGPQGEVVVPRGPGIGRAPFPDLPGLIERAVLSR